MRAGFAEAVRKVADAAESAGPVPAVRQSSASRNSAVLPYSRNALQP